MKSTPGPDCTICDHPKRADIEEKLAAGVSSRDISCQLGRNAPSYMAVQRHKQNCMREAVLAAREADAIVLVEEGKSIVERCREVNREAWALLNEAKSEQDRKVYASLLGQALKSLELEAKLLGEIGPTNQVNTQINVGQSATPPPAWYVAATRGAPKADETLARWLLDAGGGDSFDECAENARRNLEDAVGRWLPRRC